jgi:hypothetical protein
MSPHTDGLHACLKLGWWHAIGAWNQISALPFGDEQDIIQRHAHYTCACFLGMNLRDKDEEGVVGQLLTIMLDLVVAQLGTQISICIRCSFYLKKVCAFQAGKEEARWLEENSPLQSSERGLASVEHAIVQVQIAMNEFQIAANPPWGVRREARGARHGREARGSRVLPRLRNTVLYCTVMYSTRAAAYQLKLLNKSVSYSRGSR